MRQSPVGEPAATAALNLGTPRRRSSLKRLCPFRHCRQRYERNLRRIQTGAGADVFAVFKRCTDESGAVAVDPLHEPPASKSDDFAACSMLPEPSGIGGTGAIWLGPRAYDPMP